jgi:phosphoribosylaminoimidazole (AIR) synthetase
MSHVFNMGLGLVFMVSPFYAKTVTEIASALGLKTWTIGRAEVGTGKSRWR